MELRAKSVWRIKFVVLRPFFYPPNFWPKNTLKWAPFWKYFFHFFWPKSSNNWWTQERNHSHPILHINEVIPKAQSELENFLTLCKLTMEGSSWGWLTIYIKIVHYFHQHPGHLTKSYKPSRLALTKVYITIHLSSKTPQDILFMGLHLRNRLYTS